MVDLQYHIKFSHYDNRTTSSRTFYYTRYILHQIVQLVCGAHFVIARGQHISHRNISTMGSPGNTDLTGPRFEPKAYRFRDERITAKPTGRSLGVILVLKK